MKNKTINRHDVWSNSAYALPATIAFASGFLFLGYATILVALVSTAYHAISEAENDWWWDCGRKPHHEFLLWADTILGNTLALYLLTQILPKADQGQIITLIALVLPSVYFLFGKTPRDYETRHSLWHTLSAVALTYAFLIL